MPKIVGVVRTSFTAKDGTQISGRTFFTEEPVKPDHGIGQRTDRFFLSDAKLATLSFKPDLALGFEVQILYNRYGKVENLVLIDQLDSDLEVET